MSPSGSSPKQMAAPGACSRGTYHAARRVHLAIRNALEVAGTATVVAGAVSDRPEGREQVIDGFKVGGQHRFFPWREKAPLGLAGSWRGQGNPQRKLLWQNHVILISKSEAKEVSQEN